MSSLIEVKEVNASYITSKGEINAVNDASLEIRSSEILGIVGESGSGKSTLMKIIYGFIEPPLRVTRGDVILHEDRGSVGMNILSLDRETLRKRIWWRFISWIPQGAQNSLNPTLRIRDIFIETLKRFVNMDKRELVSFVEDHILKLGLPRDILTAYPHQLSGGMKQRVVIALAIALKPKVVLADEPTSALDVVTQGVVLNMLKNIRDQYGTSIVLVSHDMDVVGVLSDRIAVMYAGNVVEVGDADNLLENPLHPYTRALIESLPRLGDKRERKGLKGQPPDLMNPPSGCRFHPRCPYAESICMRKSPPFVKVESNRFIACWLYAGDR